MRFCHQHQVTAFIIVNNIINVHPTCTTETLALWTIKNLRSSNVTDYTYTTTTLHPTTLHPHGAVTRIGRSSTTRFTFILISTIWNGTSQNTNSYFSINRIVLFLKTNTGLEDLSNSFLWMLKLQSNVQMKMKYLFFTFKFEPEDVYDLFQRFKHDPDLQLLIQRRWFTINSHVRIFSINKINTQYLRTGWRDTSNPPYSNAEDGSYCQCNLIISPSRSIKPPGYSNAGHQSPTTISSMP